MRLSKLLGTLALGVMLSHVPTTLWAESTPLDTSVSAPGEAPASDTKYSGPPILNFYLSDEDFLIIKIDGLRLEQVEGFTWSGMDISDLIEQFRQAGTVEQTEREDGLDLTVKIDIRQLAGKNEFGVIYANGNKLSATVDSEKLLAQADAKTEDRAFGYLRVYGNVQERVISRCGCSSAWKGASYTTLYFWVKDAGQFKPVGYTIADGNGNYDVKIDGICGAVVVRAVTSSGKSAEISTSVPSCGATYRTYVGANLSLW